MFKTTLILGAVALGVFTSGIQTASAGPLCANPVLCKIPLQPLPPGPGPVLPGKIKFPLKPIILPPGPLPVPPSPPSPPPGPSFGINVNLNGGDPGYYGGDGYVSCHAAKSIVRHSGFRHVHTQSCGEGDYTFLGTKHGDGFIIEVSDSGDIINVDPAD